MESHPRACPGHDCRHGVSVLRGVGCGNVSLQKRMAREEARERLAEPAS